MSTWSCLIGQCAGYSVSVIYTGFIVHSHYYISISAQCSVQRKLWIQETFSVFFLQETFSVFFSARYFFVFLLQSFFSFFFLFETFLFPFYRIFFISIWNFFYFISAENFFCFLYPENFSLFFLQKTFSVFFPQETSLLRLSQNDFVNRPLRDSDVALVIVVALCSESGPVLFLGRVRFGAGHFGAGTIGRQNFFFWIRFSVATLFQFVARFARGKIEDPCFNRFALNGIQEIACFIVFSS